jgi:hypothetical protein
VARQRQDAAGAYRFVVAPDAPGWWSYRVTAGPLARELPGLDVHRVFTYSLATRGQVGDDGASFGAEVAATYADPRGWLRSHRRFAQVASGGDLTVVLAEARLVPSYSRACSVLYSCRVGRNVVLNSDRWRSGRRAFPGASSSTGRWSSTTRPATGSGSATRPARAGPAGAGDAAAVQGHAGLRPNAWPLDHELVGVRR